MANPQHLAILKQGVEQWNTWLKSNAKIVPDLAKSSLPRVNLAQADLVEADLKEANLSRANLVHANLRMANLSGANLSGARLWRSDLGGANLEGAKLTSADFHGANLQAAYLRGANLTRATLLEVDFFLADLGNANLSEANLKMADFATAELLSTDFKGARTNGTHFDNVDLSSAKNLETVVHLGPSTVGIDTFYRSRGQIPEVFLRGCGVPEEFIRYIGSIVGRPIEFYSCFMSYSTQDQAFAERLYADLQNKGVRCWFAPHDIQGGRKVHEQLDEAIRLHDKLLLILSEHSMNSTWVKTEIANALQKTHPSNRSLGGAPEAGKNRVLFPITLAPFEEIKQWKLFDADRGIDSAREIREYFIPDFSNWKTTTPISRPFSGWSRT